MLGLTLTLLAVLACPCVGFLLVRNLMKTAPALKPSFARAPLREDAPHTDVVDQIDVSSSSDNEVPRLYADSDELIKWVEKYGGVFNADIALEKEGWSLSACGNIPINTALVRIPKKLCIYADASYMGTPLLDSTSSLMSSLQSTQWRARLAIAILSERVRPESFFSPYIRNLPFEFWGMPLFYTTSELRMTQDYSVLQRTRNRIRFLSEFTSTVLASLQKTPMDPFSGNIADVNALAWGFAAASSRALRNVPGAASTQHIDKSSPRIIDTTAATSRTVSAVTSSSTAGKIDAGDSAVEAEPAVTSSGPVMVPLIDFAAHSFSPSCAVRDTGTEYVLYTVRPVRAGEELTINYGALSNEELFDDYGFTVDNNPHDSVQVKVDDVLVNAARMVIGQSNCTPSTQGGVAAGKHSAAGTSDGANWVPDKTAAPVPLSLHYSKRAPRGVPGSARNSMRITALGSGNYCDNSLRAWQKVWLQCIGRAGLSAQPMEVTIGSTNLASTNRPSVDPRLLAFLRVIYSSQEADLLKHGYTPFTLQSAGSMLAAPEEAQVTRTLIGMLALVLRSYGTELASDVNLLKSNQLEITVDAGLTDDKLATKSTADLALKGAANAASGGLSLALQQQGWFGDSSLSKSLHAEPAALKAECRQVLRGILRSTKPVPVQTPMSGPAAPVPVVSKSSSLPVLPAEVSTVHATMHASAIIHSAQRGSVDPSLLTLDPAVAEHGDVTAASNTMSRAGEVVDLSNLRQLGGKLPVNVREAYRYRIRRKKLLRDLVLQLADLYELLRAEPGSEIADLGSILGGDAECAGATATATAPISGIINSHSHSKLASRTAQIRELLGEEKKRSAKDEALQKLKSLSSKWASSAGADNLNL